MPRDSIVIYDVTDQLSDLQQFISPSPTDQFIVDTIPTTTRTPATIVLTPTIYLNGSLVTSSTTLPSGATLTIKWYRYVDSQFQEITATDTEYITSMATGGWSITLAKGCNIQLVVTYAQNGVQKVASDTYTIIDVDTTDTPVVTLSHPGIMFNYDQSGSVNVMQYAYYKGVDITATAQVTGKSWDKCPIGGSAWENVSTGQTSQAITISDAGYIFKFSCTINGKAYSASIAVQKQVQPAVIQYLSNEQHVLPASSNGTVSNYGGSGTDIFVLQNGTLLTPTSNTSVGDNEFKLDTKSAISGTITIGETTVDTTNKKITIANHSAMSTDVAVIRYTIKYKIKNGSETTITLDQTITKSKAGVDSTVYYITQSDNVFYKATDGTLTPTSITFNQYSITGNQAPVAFTGYWRVSKSGTPLYQDPTTQQSTYIFSALEAGTARYDVYLFKDAGKSQLLDQQTVIRVDQGVTGQPATSYWLDVSPSVIIVTKDGKFNGAASQSLTATGYSQTGAGAPTTGAGTIKYKIPPSETETTYVSSVSISDSTKTQVIFNMYIGTQLVDTVSVPIIKEAVDQITVVLSNQNVTIPADENKLPLSSQSTGTKINVYEGVTQLTAKLKANILSTGQFKVSADPSVTNQSGTTITTGFTVGKITASGTTLTVADHSITETGATSYVVKYIIQYKRQNGTDGTVEVYQNIAKQITGMQPFYIVLQQDNNMITVVGSSCTITQTVYRNGSQQTDTDYDYKWTVDGVAKVPNGGSQMGSSGYYNGTNQNKVTLTDANITTKAVVECDARVHQIT